MKSQTVIVKNFENRPLIKQAVYSHGNIVFITSREALDRMNNGDNDLFPVGFRSENVFFYDGKPLPSKIDWKKLVPWTS